MLLLSRAPGPLTCRYRTGQKYAAATGRAAFGRKNRPGYPAPAAGDGRPAPRPHRPSRLLPGGGQFLPRRVEQFSLAKVDHEPAALPRRSAARPRPPGPPAGAPARGTRARFAPRSRRCSPHPAAPDASRWRPGRRQVHLVQQNQSAPGPRSGAERPVPGGERARGIHHHQQQLRPGPGPGGSCACRPGPPRSAGWSTRRCRRAAPAPARHGIPPPEDPGWSRGPR